MITEREFCQTRKKQTAAHLRELEMQGMDKKRKEHQQRNDHYFQLLELQRRRDECEDLLTDDKARESADPRSIAFATFMREKQSGLWGGPDGMDDAVRIREDMTTVSSKVDPRRVPRDFEDGGVSHKKAKLDEEIERLMIDPTPEMKEVISIMEEESRHLVRMSEVEFLLRGPDSGYCHGCKHTGAKTIHFCPRGYKAHGLCAVHFDKEFRMTLSTAMAMSKSQDPSLLPVCPVCSLSCNCRSCLRMKTRRAAELMRKYALDEGGEVGDMELPPPEIVKAEVSTSYQIMLVIIYWPCWIKGSRYHIAGGRWSVTLFPQQRWHRKREEGPRRSP